MTEAGLDRTQTKWERATAIVCCGALTFWGALALGFVVNGSATVQPTQTWLETVQSAGLFVLTLGFAAASGGPWKLTQRAAGRIALTGLFASATLLFYPPFHRLTADRDVGAISYWAKIAPILACVVLWMFGPRNKRGVMIENITASDRLEAFLMRPSVRFNLFVLTLMTLPAMASMSGLAVRSAFWPVAFTGAILLALNPLLRIARTAFVGWMLCAFVLAASGVAALQGVKAYRELQTAEETAIVGTEQSKPAEAQKAYDRVLELSKTLRTNGPRLEMEAGMARQLEKQNNPSAALAYWERVATLSKVDQTKFAPIRRVKSALGDSLPAWRMLVYEGFPSISNPEMAPGVMRLGEIAPDVRAKLLAALLAWDRQAPEAERRKLLEAVQAVLPGEVSSLNLLKRLGGPVKDVPMMLPPELITGRIPTLQSVLGTIEEEGEVCTVVCLNEGHWEMSLRAAGTPLHEEWPVVRVEMNGKTLATTQVNKAVEHDVPFTFDVTRDDIFKVRIVFQNRQEDLEEGHASRRGLKILGIKFSHAKE